MQSTGQVNASCTTFFHLIKQNKKTIDERDVRNMIIAEVEATSWRLREYIRVRKLAARSRLGRMCRLRILDRGAEGL